MYFLLMEIMYPTIHTIVLTVLLGQLWANAVPLTCEIHQTTNGKVTFKLPPALVTLASHDSCDAQWSQNMTSIAEFYDGVPYILSWVHNLTVDSLTIPACEGHVHYHLDCPQTATVQDMECACTAASLIGTSPSLNKDYTLWIVCGVVGVLVLILLIIACRCCYQQEWQQVSR
ncbi:uncharacterized protein LOC136767632 isoform X2 [Amia ocellicauda]|uniref:uncharacterized protein LOC136767632 isoform X2 n=1 Tax=Amia ocellicauda TaxID=2972642 RepID=UPI0034638D81